MPTQRAQGSLRSLCISSLTIDPRLQMRVDGLNDEHVEDLWAVLRAGKRLPCVPVRVVEDPPGYPPGIYSFPTDGFHTIEAYKREARITVPAAVQRGTWEDAITDAVTANLGPQHRALKLSHKDKRRAVATALATIPDWATKRIADLLGVSDSLVAAVRGEHSSAGQHPESGCSPSSDSRRVGADGKTRGPRHAAPKAPEPAGVQVEGNRGLPLDECRLDLDDESLAALESHGVTTLGEVADHLARGDDFSLKGKARADLGNQLANLGVGPWPATPRRTPQSEGGEAAGEPAARKPGDARYDFRRFESHFGVVARAPDAIRSAYPEFVTPGDVAAMDRHLGEFLKHWNAVKGKVTRTSCDD